MTDAGRPVRALRPVREIPCQWIPASDGRRLAARIWLPEDAERAPVPAVLEAVPYRKNDGTAIGDAMRHRYVAERGYATVRLDLGGSGDSDGVLRDEYRTQEHDECVDTIAWLAAQSWCSGRVGMTGISWGGFNALQVAARRPPALRAIITACASDDRYADDVHYLGGCVLAHDALSWGTALLGISACPPDPAHVGDAWRPMWRERLESAHPPLEAWLRHQRRDAYWEHGSVCEDAGAIAIPVLAVGGWADGYTDAVFRLLEGLSAPRLGIVGPWSHAWPESARPGPAIGFLQECVRWWDRWLCDEDKDGHADDVMDEPMLRAWMQESVEPGSPGEGARMRPGRWVGERAWPPRRDRSDDPRWFLAEAGLRAEPGPPSELEVGTDLGHGTESGAWCPLGARADLPGDQCHEDRRGLVFDAAPTPDRQEILGHPRVCLRVSSDQPIAQLVLRLCDVAPDGASLLVTRGVLNLCHRDGHAAPASLQPGRPVDVRLSLHAIAHVLPPGHHWRLVLAPSYWPLFWPPPGSVTLRVRTGERSVLELPVRTPRPEDARIAFAEPETASAPALDLLRRPKRARTSEREGERLVLRSESDAGGVTLRPSGLAFDASGSDAFTVRDDDPLSAVATSSSSRSFERGDWRARIVADGSLSCTAQHFQVETRLRAWEGESAVFERAWSFRIPRDLV